MTIKKYNETLEIKNAIGVKIKYEENRSNPAEVFEAMGLYIRFQTDIGQIILNSLGQNYYFELELQDVQKSSILSILSPKLDQKLFELYKRASNRLVQEIVVLPEEITEENIEDVAIKIQEEIQEYENLEFPPVISKKALKHAVKNYSAANEKVFSTESVEFISYTGRDQKVVSLNTKQRLSKNAPQDELENSQKHELNLIVISPKNQGVGAWSFKSEKLNKSFDARILDTNWLKRYQSQIINPIGPKDVIVADVRLFNDKETKEIKKAQILKIKKEIRALKQSNINYE